MPDGFAVSIQDVTKSFPLENGERVSAVAGVSLDVNAATVTALTGPSGSGKSTLLNLIGGLDRPDGGEVIVAGQALSELSRNALADYRRGVGFVFQRFNLLPALTAIDNVLAPVIPYRVSFDAVARARELLTAVGIEEKADAIPSRMSGGQQQRVAIARALINQPGLLLADEPTGNLDSRTGGEITDLLLRLRDEHGMTIMIATHDPQLALRCGRFIQLRDGEVTVDADVGQTAPDAVLEHLRPPSN
jgi:putative ABC transport system ATP-binding protein